MLSALRLRDFVLTQQAELELSPGFTVITGETGAGKSVLFEALRFALGGSADAVLVRPGAERTEVEAVFDLRDSPSREAVAAALEQLDVPFDGELVLRRWLALGDSGGRGASRRLSGRLRINDRTATLETVRGLAPLLVDIHGQREHLSLLRPGQCLALLDRFAGLGGPRDDFAGMVRRLHALDRRLDAFEGDERERARRVAMLRHEASEIAAAGLRHGEEEELRSEHSRLLHAARLVADSEAARTALESDVLGDALATVRRIVEVDDGAVGLGMSMEAAAEHAADALRELRSYADTIVVDPARLAEVEARLSLIAQLERRWGDGVAEVIAYGEQASQEADQLEGQEADLAQIRAEAGALLRQIEIAALELSASRREAAQRFVAAILEECQSLHLEGAVVEVAFEPIRVAVDGRAITAPDDAQVGFDQTGMDRIELLVSFNPDAPPRPLQRVASGGETARLTLAIKAVLGDRDAVPVLLFDEIDVGLGGRSGATVGERLARLGQSHQVLCITHLPQVASYASAHLRVRKVAERSGTLVVVETLDAAARLTELAEMLGADSEANRTSARALLRAGVDR